MTIDERQVIFDKVLALLKTYSPPYTLRDAPNVSGKRSVDLTAYGDFEAFGRKRKEMFFAGLIMQKHYVGFYFMPIYSDEAAMRQVLSERLLKCLKGKSCFYLTKHDPELLADIRHALSKGFRLYKARGWV